ncbi:sulfatase-like hydrolase/transferase, partial [Providencia vermicola]
MTVSRRSFIKGLAASGAAMSVSSPILANSGKPSNGMPARPDNAPNLLIIFPDEMRAHALQFMGEDPSITPNLNKFAKQAKVMTQMASNYPLCSPFRGMFMTGQYPVRNGITGNAHDYGGKVGIDLSPY